MFDKVLISNRGEIAVRIARTCTDLGIASVAVYSDVDAGAKHVAEATESVHLPGVAPTDTYLNVSAIVAAARATGAQAVHPGYGFLSENADAAAAVASAGLAWVGPPPDVTRAFGDKIKARAIAAEAGVPVVPGLSEPVEDPSLVRDFAAEHGYPVAVKAAGGGGGRGLKVVRSEHELEDAFATARREAEDYFGSRDVYVEKYLESPKHLEVQILAPRPDEALWLGVRDCSLQRRHQKLIEETPPPRFPDLSPAMGQAAVALAKAGGYVNAGTVEMLLEPDGNFYFLEVNARLQVEHTVTEEVLGLDLVACQLRIASGEPLGFSQEDLRPRGAAIECRINAEDPSAGFVPTPGRITRYEEPSGAGIRVDSGYRAGDEVPSAYDSLIAKVIATGADREEARTRMISALEDMRIEGIATTIPAHLVLLRESSFVAGAHSTTTVEQGALDDLAPSSPSAVLLVDGETVELWHPGMAASAAAAVRGGGEATAPMQGTIVKILVSLDQEVDVGEPLAVLEAMKMETVIAAATSGRVSAIHAEPGGTVAAGQVVVEVQ